MAKLQVLANRLQDHGVGFKIIAADNDTEAKYFKSWLELLAGFRSATELSQLAHWNVKGINFQELHSFFDHMYSTYFNYQDRTAEHMLALYPEYTVPDGDKFGVDGVIPRYKNTSNSPRVFVKIQYLILDKLHSSITHMSELANTNKDVGGANMLGGFAEELDKMRWQAKALLARAK